MKRILVVSLFLLSLHFGFAPAAAGYARVFEISNAGVNIMAPDWIWQGQNVNIAASVENKDAVEKKFQLRLTMPEENHAYFKLPVEPGVSGLLPGGGKLRLAVTGLAPLPDAPLKEYVLTISIFSEGHEEHFEYPLKVIRGSLVEAGIWSVALPALIALVWGVSFCFVLPRFSKPGAWKKTSASFPEEAEERSWFSEG